MSFLPPKMSITITASGLPSNPADNAGPMIITLSVVFTLLSTLVLLTRLYVRAKIIRNLGWDDTVMSISVVINLGGMASFIVQVYFGAGRHVGDLTAENTLNAMRLNFVSQVVYTVALCLCKLSVGFSLLRIAATKVWKYVIIGFMCLVAIYSTVTVILVLFQCDDIRSNYDFTIPKKCWATAVTTGLAYMAFSLNIFTDLVFAIFIPIPMLWSLNVNPRTRNILIAILGLGLFGCIAGCVRISYLGSYGASGDWLWDGRNLAIWTILELNMGIVAGSLPTLRPLARRLLGSVASRSKSSKSRANTNTQGPYGHGSRGGSKAMKPDKWQQLSSGRRTAPSPLDMPDDTSSERALYLESGISHEQYEMKGYVTTVSAAGKSDGVSTRVESHDRSSEDVITPDRFGGPEWSSRNITKTTTTTVSYQKQPMYPQAVARPKDI